MLALIPCVMSITPAASRRRWADLYFGGAEESPFLSGRALIGCRRRASEIRPVCNLWGRQANKGRTCCSKIKTDLGVSSQSGGPLLAQNTRIRTKESANWLGSWKAGAPYNAGADVRDL